MIRWYMRIDRKVVEQRSLFDLSWSHHRLSSCLNKTESMSFRPFNQRLFQRYRPITDIGRLSSESAVVQVSRFRLNGARKRVSYSPPDDSGCDARRRRSAQSQNLH